MVTASGSRAPGRGSDRQRAGPVEGVREAALPVRLAAGLGWPSYLRADPDLGVAVGSRVDSAVGIGSGGRRSVGVQERQELDRVGHLQDAVAVGIARARTEGGATLTSVTIISTASVSESVPSDTVTSKVEVPF